MNSKETVSVSAARPKVHRLPASVVRPKTRLSLVVPRPDSKGQRSVWLSGVAVLAVVGVAFAMFQSSDAPTDEESMTVGTPITTAVLPDADDVPAAAMLTPEEKKLTIVLQGDSDAIIGQLVKIPAENEHITEIKSVSDIDNSAGRELLSIISKY